jgi:thioredoxin-related protein
MKKTLLLLSIVLICNVVVAQKKALVLIFFDTECPICQTYTGKLQGFYRKYQSQIDFKIVYPTKNTTRGEVRRFEREYSFKIPFVLDPHLDLVTKHDATTTPEVVMCNERGEVIYRGAIDNQFVGLGKFRPKTTETYLQNTLENWLHNKPINPQKTEPIGCLINRK